MLYVELDADGQRAPSPVRAVPRLPAARRRTSPTSRRLLARPECAWITRELEQKAQGHAIANVVPEHVDEVRGRRLALDREDPRRGEGPADQGDHATGTTAPSS